MGSLGYSCHKHLWVDELSQTTFGSSVCPEHQFLQEWSHWHSSPCTLCPHSHSWVSDSQPGGSGHLCLGQLSLWVCSPSLSSLGSSLAAASLEFGALCLRTIFQGSCWPWMFAGEGLRVDLGWSLRPQSTPVYIKLFQCWGCPHL